MSAAQREPLRLRLLPLSIAAIVTTTIIPVHLRRPSLAFLDTSINRADVLNNLLLYLPLGLACGNASLLTCIALAFGVSFSAEVIQFGCVNRDPSPVDVLANVIGAFAGYILALLIKRLWNISLEVITVSRALAAPCLVVAALSIFGLAWHKTRADFSNWDPECQLAIGNELTCDRPWSGTVDAVAIYAEAISAEQVQRLTAEGPAAVSPPSNHELPERLFYRSDEPAQAKGCPTEQLSTANTELLIRNLQKTGEITMLAWITPRNTNQKGPARIITLSRDAYRRDFTLGQIGRSLTFRLRTPGTGSNGTSPALFTPPVLSADKRTFVALTYDGYVSRAYIDGKLASEVNLGARRPRFPGIIVRSLPGPLPLADLEINICEVVIGCLAAIGLLGFANGPLPDARYIWIRSLAISAACGAIVWLLCVSEPKLGVRVVLLSIAGGIAAAVSVVQTGRHHFTSSNATGD